MLKPDLVRETIGGAGAMALYKYASNVTQADQDAFDILHRPGSGVPDAGIYCCQGCGDEIAVRYGERFPTSDDHAHPDGRPVEWRLLVFAQQRQPVSH